MNPLVSIITPCYNGEKYLKRYFESILQQTYTNCQLIFMDDGSTDRTKEIVESYREKLVDKGISIEYYYNTNRGQAYAVGEGLKYIKGEFYIWPDADDILTSDSIQKKVDFLQKHLDYAMVRSDCKVVWEDDLETTVELSAWKNNNRFQEDLFENCLLMKQFYFQTGCYMVRTAALLEVNPKKYIFESRAGQNIQMLLPVLYNNKCGYIDEPLYIYIRSKKSHSNSIGSDYDSKIARIDSFEEVFENTIKNTLIQNKEVNILQCKKNILQRKIDLAFDYKKDDDASRFYYQLKEITHVIPMKYLIKGKLGKYKITTICLNLFRRILSRRKNDE